MSDNKAGAGSFDRRQFMAALAGGTLVACGSGGPAAAGTAQGGAAGAVAVPSYRRAGERDDSAAFSRALATGQPVYVPAGAGSGPGGVYLVNRVQLPAGARLFGDGPATVIRPSGANIRNAFVAASAAPELTLAGIRLSNFRLHGHVEEAGFLEHYNLLDLAGVEDLLIENVVFSGFRSDAIILDGDRQLNPQGTRLSPRHNRGVVIRGCRFDGINRDNRNAITIVDGIGVTFENCAFLNCSRDDMPGAIDVEPNPYPFYVIRDIAVRNCTFTNCGGSNGCVGVYIPREVATLASGFEISGNRFENNPAPDIFFNLMRAWSDSDPSCRVDIRNNRGVNGGSRPWRIQSVKGVTIAADNSWTDYAASTLLGYTDPLDQVHSFVDEGTYLRVGRGGPPSGFGIAVFNVAHARFSGNYVDCGDGSPDAAAIAFIAGRATDIQLVGARMSAPGRRTRFAVRIFGSRVSRLRNRAAENQFGGLVSQAVS